MAFFRSMLLCLSLLYRSGSGSRVSRDGTTAKQPNIIFILTDDQDLRMDSLSYMPYLQKHITEQGTTFGKHYCTVAQCCPSRVTIWTGKAAHNTNVTDVNPPYGRCLQHSSFCIFIDPSFRVDHSPILRDNSLLKFYFTLHRWLAQVCLSRFQLRLPPHLATRTRLRNILHRKTFQCPQHSELRLTSSSRLDWLRVLTKPLYVRIPQCYLRSEP